VAEVVQSHRLLDVLEAVQALERQSVGLPPASAVLTEHVLTEHVVAEHVLAEHVVAGPTAALGGLVDLLREVRGPGSSMHHVNGPSRSGSRPG
jgi:hypothetical protein